MIHPARAACALACVAALAACAGGPPSGRRPPGGGPGGGGGRGFTGLIVQPIALLFTDFDADGDRRVTRDEQCAGAEAAWRAADANADGSASAFEFVDWLGAVMGSETATPGRTAFDRNLDNAITRAEFLATLSDEFARLDKNGDGVVERPELVRLIEPSFTPGPDSERPSGPGRGGRQPPGGGPVAEPER